MNVKVLVFSDAHGSTWGVEEAIALHPDAQHVIFLGDGVAQIEDLSICYPDLTFHLLAGNCDFTSDLPCEAVLTIGGARIFACHGHTLGVKQGLGAAMRRAALENADVLLYGHTHEPDSHYEDGITVLNPGSVGRPSTGSRKEYAILDITEKGILASLATV